MTWYVSFIASCNNSMRTSSMASDEEDNDIGF